MNKGNDKISNYLISEELFFEILTGSQKGACKETFVRGFINAITFSFLFKQKFTHNIFYFNSYREAGRKLNMSPNTIRKNLSDAQRYGLAVPVSGEKWKAKYAYEIVSLKNRKKRAGHIRIRINQDAKRKDIKQEVYVAYSAFIINRKTVQASRLYNGATAKKVSENTFKPIKRYEAAVNRLRGYRGRFKNDKLYRLHVENEAAMMQSQSYHYIQTYYGISKTRMRRTQYQYHFQDIVDMRPVWMVTNVKKLSRRYPDPDCVHYVPRIPYSRRTEDEGKGLVYRVECELTGKHALWFEGCFIHDEYRITMANAKAYQEISREQHRFVTPRSADKRSRMMPDYDREWHDAETGEKVEAANIQVFKRVWFSNSCVFTERKANRRMIKETPEYRFFQRYRIWKGGASK